MARRRIEKDPAAPASPWDWLIAGDERNRREREAYALACQLDTEGKYGEADQALRAGGVREEVVQNRRLHLEWRLSQGMSAIEQSIPRASWRTET
jgi:hypothetical protein